MSLTSPDARLVFTDLNRSHGGNTHTHTLASGFYYAPKTLSIVLLDSFESIEVRINF